MMKVTICDDKKQLGFLAGAEGARLINDAIGKNGEANAVFVAGESQIETLKSLVSSDVDWSKVNIFHLAEYVGIDKGNKGSSHTFLHENFLNLIKEPKSYTPIDSDEKHLEKTINNLNKQLQSIRLDVAFICIGENGHLAFNDPPADISATDPYIVVSLDRKSRKQMANEGWFKTIDEVPLRAITMSINEILSSEHIIVSCPDQRKAKAVASCLFSPMSTFSPSSALQHAKDCSLYLDRLSSCMVFSDLRTN